MKFYDGRLILVTFKPDKLMLVIFYSSDKNDNASKQAVNLDVFRLSVAFKRTLFT